MTGKGSSSKTALRTVGCVVTVIGLVLAAVGIILAATNNDLSAGIKYGLAGAGIAVAFIGVIMIFVGNKKGATVVAVKPVNCMNCGEPNPPGSKFCRKCGKPMVKKCVNCGAVLDEYLSN